MAAIDKLVEALKNPTAQSGGATCAEIAASLGVSSARVLQKMRPLYCAGKIVVGWRHGQGMAGQRTKVPVYSWRK